MSVYQVYVVPSGVELCVTKPDQLFAVPTQRYTVGRYYVSLPNKINDSYKKSECFLDWPVFRGIVRTDIDISCVQSFVSEKILDTTDYDVKAMHALFKRNFVISSVLLQKHTILDWKFCRVLLTAEVIQEIKSDPIPYNESFIRVELICA